MSDETTSVTGWVLAGLGGIVSTLAATVAFLFKLRENENAKNIAELKNDLAESSKRSEKCEEDRGILYTKCAVLEAKIENLECKILKIDKDGTQFSHRKDA